MQTRVLMRVMPVVVPMAVDMLKSRMPVAVRVLARKEHEHRGHQHDQAGDMRQPERFTQGYESHARTNERGGCEDPLGARRAELLCR